MAAQPQHLAIPYGYDITGSALTVSQDGRSEVAQCVRVLMSTPTRTRAELFDYGIPDPTFRDGRDLPARVAAALTRWEPRAAQAVITVKVADDGSAQITAQLP